MRIKIIEKIYQRSDLDENTKLILIKSVMNSKTEDLIKFNELVNSRKTFGILDNHHDKVHDFTPCSLIKTLNKDIVNDVKSFLNTYSKEDLIHKILNDNQLFKRFDEIYMKEVGEKYISDDMEWINFHSFEDQNLKEIDLDSLNEIELEKIENSFFEFQNQLLNKVNIEILLFEGDVLKNTFFKKNYQLDFPISRKIFMSSVLNSNMKFYGLEIKKEPLTFYVPEKIFGYLVKKNRGYDFFGFSKCNSSFISFKKHNLSELANFIEREKVRFVILIKDGKISIAD